MHIGKMCFITYW